MTRTTTAFKCPLCGEGGVVHIGGSTEACRVATLERIGVLQADYDEAVALLRESSDLLRRIGHAMSVNRYEEGKAAPWFKGISEATIRRQIHANDAIQAKQEKGE